MLHEYTSRNLEIGRVVEWFSRRGLRNIVFDLDSTLVATDTTFRRRIDNFARWVVDNSSYQRTLEDVVRDFYLLHSEVKKTHFVNPIGFEVLGYSLAKAYGLHNRQDVDKEVQELVECYEEAPELIPGAVETLDVVTEIGLEKGIITHAGEWWTGVKLAYTGLDKFFPQERVHCIGVNGRKEVLGWRDGFYKFGFDEVETLIVGDNFTSDIIPAKEAGAWGAVWVMRMHRGNYPLHPYLVDPDHNVFVVERIGEMLDSLIGK